MTLENSGGKTIQLSCWTERENIAVLVLKSNHVSSQSWLRSLFVALLTCKVAADHPKATASTPSSQIELFGALRFNRFIKKALGGLIDRAASATVAGRSSPPPPPRVVVAPLKCKPRVQLCLLWLCSPRRNAQRCHAVATTVRVTLQRQCVWSAAATSLAGETRHTFAGMMVRIVAVSPRVHLDTDPRRLRQVSSACFHSIWTWPHWTGISVAALISRTAWWPCCLL